MGSKYELGFIIVILIVFICIAGVLTSILFISHTRGSVDTITSGILLGIELIGLTTVVLLILRNTHCEKMRKLSKEDTISELEHKKNWEESLLIVEERRGELRIRERTKLQKLELDKKQFEYDLDKNSKS